MMNRAKLLATFLAMAVSFSAASAIIGKLDLQTRQTAAGLVKVDIKIPNTAFAGKRIGLAVHMYDINKAATKCDPAVPPSSALEFRTFVTPSSSSDTGVSATMHGSVWTSVATPTARVYSAVVSADQLRRHINPNTPIVSGGGAASVMLSACVFSAVNGAITESAMMTITATNGPSDVSYDVSVSLESVNYNAKDRTDALIKTVSSVTNSDVVDLMFIDSIPAVSCVSNENGHSEFDCQMTTVPTDPSVTSAGNSARCISLVTFENGTRQCTQLWNLVAIHRTSQQAVEDGAVAEKRAVVAEIDFIGRRISTSHSELQSATVSTKFVIPVVILKTASTNFRSHMAQSGNLKSAVAPNPLLDISTEAGPSKNTASIDASVPTRQHVAVVAVEASDVCISIKPHDNDASIAKITSAFMIDCAEGAIDLCKHAQIVTEGAIDSSFAINIGGNVTVEDGESKLCFTAISGLQGRIVIAWRTAPMAPLAAAKKSFKSSMQLPISQHLKHPSLLFPVMPQRTPVWCKDDKSLCTGSFVVDLIVQCKSGRVYNNALGYCV